MIQSACAPEKRTATPQRLISVSKWFENSCGLVKRTTMPSFSNAALTSGIWTMARSSDASRSTTGCGVPPVVMTPVQESISISGKPDSTSVGASGNRGLRARVDTASSLALPAWMDGADAGPASNKKSTSPASSDAIAGPTPLNGMWSALNLAWYFISSTMRWVLLPLPLEA